ncbi:MAG: M50 family metallopeptidase [Bradymonadia bacterium]
MSESNQANRVAQYLLVSIVITLLLYFVIPYGRLIGYPLVLLSTLAHEMGHGIAAVLVGGQFLEFTMHDNGSGVAVTAATPHPLQRAAVLAGGLIGPAVVAGLGFRLGRREKAAKTTLMIMGIFLFAANIWVVRNLFGFFFVFLAAGMCVFIARKASPTVCQFSLLFVSTQLALSVFSRADYLFTKEANLGGGRSMPSDVSQMADALILPYWFWGCVCGGLSLWVLYNGIRSSLESKS